MHVAFYLVNLQECERMAKSRKKNSAEVMGSDNGKLNRRSTRFGQWKAESLSDRFRQWKAGSRQNNIRRMKSKIDKWYRKPTPKSTPLLSSHVHVTHDLFWIVTHHAKMNRCSI